MIIYGWNSKLIKHAPLENIECEHCQQKTSLLGIHSNYVHIFWIPVFPYSKSAIIVCTHCQHATGEKDMKPDFKARIKAIKGAVPVPKYQFSGLGIILALVVYFTFQSYRNDNVENEYLNAPLAGDVYVLRNDEEATRYKYYLLKVQSLEEDSILISPNSFGYSGIPAKLDAEDGFYDYSAKIAKTTLLEKHKNGELKKVIRDNNSTNFSRTIEYKEEEIITDEDGLSYEE